MTVKIRLAQPEIDFPRIAELLSLPERERITAVDLHEVDANKSPGTFRRHAVAVDEKDAVMGYSLAVHYASAPPGEFEIALIVDPGWRNQGLGRQLYDDLMAYLQAQNAARIACVVREQQSEALRFAQKRRFAIELHEVSSVLEVAGFDNGRFANLLANLEADGLQFFSYDTTGNTLDARQKLYAINRIAALDDPASDGTFAAFETWQNIVVNAAWFQPAGQMIAADEEKFVGMAAAVFDAERNVVETAVTGVHPDYRGRQIATALKLQIVRFAQQRGATHIFTENDTRNAAMLAINRKLGFQQLPGGYYRLVKSMR